MTTIDLRLKYKMETGENPEDSAIKSINLSIEDGAVSELEDFDYITWLEEELIKYKTAFESF